MSSPFRTRTMMIIVAVAIVSLGVAAALTIMGDELAGGEPSAGADSYSVSAIGHRGLVDILEKLDIPVVKSRSDSAAKSKKGVLLVLEPTVSDETSKERLRELVASAPRVLVVLPKWYGSATLGQEWIDDADLLPATEIDDLLKALDFQYTMGISRIGERSPFSGRDITT